MRNYLEWHVRNYLQISEPISLHLTIIDVGFSWKYKWVRIVGFNLIYPRIYRILYLGDDLKRKGDDLKRKQLDYNDNLAVFLFLPID